VSVTESAPNVQLARVLVEAGLASSNSEARRLLKQGAVKVGGEAVRDIKAEVSTGGEEPLLVQVGKRRFVRVRFLRS
jgi:tyrosyl-tRNA synthetase